MTGNAPTAPAAVSTVTLAGGQTVVAAPGVPIAYTTA
jgi:hypothetical protein